ncbi:MULTISPECIES: glycosyltransferase [Clostridium]|uniref:glycosyltransferase n=1 Tax=Clostridium TaxID=1485 RepID=UPI001DFBC010|nr:MULTISPECIES: glycosyltransferase [Clostridium]MBS5306417.1 glycosyltransferase [Clostridium sp.]MDB1943957.1 glycosyltransferase [Clostridium tertium]MDB1950877.1 glycosyltransferase [Clostridium tertium]MDU1278279.1 glycosyltransferase [Clostridium sp.]MDU2460201.1 glycosyltransferase [Clostridium sp.]
MHVMFIPSWYHNKRNPVHGSFFKEQAIALKERGIKITIAYNEIWPLTLAFKVKEKIGLNYSVEEGLKTYRYKNFNYLPKNPMMFKVFNRRLEKLYKEVVKKEGKVDLIHCQSSFWAGISANYISKKYNIPLIITEHSSLEKAIYIKESYKPLIKESYLEADELIAVGNGLKKEISKFCGRKDIKVIHNLIPIENFYISKNKNKNFTFFSLAFLEGEKGMDTLIRSYAKYLKETNSKLLIGGDGSQKDFLIKLCEELEIKNQVEFLGALSRKEVSHYMSICDSFVLASRYETFGVVYIEALASGKPIIGTYNGGAEDIINSKNGLIVKVDDVDELGNAMKYIMENSNFYNAEDIRIDCIEKFSKEKITNEILDIYDLVLDKRG